MINQADCPHNGSLMILTASDLIIIALRRLFALLLIAIVAFGVWDFPIALTVLAGLLLAYAVLLFVIPNAWLVILPAALPIFDLAPWSGRLFLNEFDFLVLTTLAVLYWRGPNQARYSNLRVRTYLIWLFAFSVGASTALALFPFPPIGLNSFDNYLSPYNALRVAKGFLWAVLLLPHLKSAYRTSPKSAQDLITIGLLIGLILTGLAVLWERGVFADLINWTGIYAIAYSLLDLSTSYRITGPFSSMHTGGTAIDGYLALTLPFAVFATLFARSLAMRMLGLAAVGLGLYSLLVTFSRGLYLGFFASLSIFLLISVISIRFHIQRHLISFLIVSFALAIASLILGGLFYLGGNQALLGGLLLTLSGATIGYLLKFGLRSWAAFPMLALTGACGVLAFFIFDGIVEFKWAPRSAEVALAASAVGSALLLISAVAVGRSPILPSRFSTVAVLALMVTLFWAAAIPAANSYRITERMSEASRDLGTRSQHWRDALDMMDTSWVTRIFGMGVGSYPRHYFSRHVGTRKLVNYAYRTDGLRSYVELGAGDFNLMQRVPVNPDETYTLQFAARSTGGNSRLTTKLCLKHILFSERYTPTCKAKAFAISGGADWQTHTFSMPSGSLGRHGLAYWPVTLMLHNGTRGATIDITDIQLIDSHGTDIIANGDFAQGGDRWFFVSDFEHLAWHTKNLYLHVYFEQGFFGLGLFILMNGLAVYLLSAQLVRGQEFAVPILSSLAGFLVVGFFGSIVDNPRIALLYFLILFLALLLPKGTARRSTPLTGAEAEEPKRIGA